MILWESWEPFPALLLDRNAGQEGDQRSFHSPPGDGILALFLLLSAAWNAVFVAGTATAQPGAATSGHARFVEPPKPQLEIIVECISGSSHCSRSWSPGS